MYEIKTAAVLRSLRGSESGSLHYLLKVCLRSGLSMSINDDRFLRVKHAERPGVLTNVIQFVARAVVQPVGWKVPQLHVSCVTLLHPVRPACSDNQTV